jgi:hypothetical protein
MIERRFSVRLSLPMRTEVRKAAGEPGNQFMIEVRLSNVSAGGAYFETSHWEPLDVGANVEVTVELPENPVYQALGVGKLRTSATVLRSQPASISSPEQDATERRGIAIKFDRPLSFA